MDNVNNYIFLDIDGVLNYEELVIRTNKFILSSWVKHGIDNNEDYNPWFCENSVRVLREIQETYNCKIVISSTWRYHLSVADFIKVFKTYYDWDTSGIIVGKTDTESGIRGAQIKRWLNTYGKFPYNYLIIDDSSDMLDSQMQNFLHISLLNGLREEHLDEAKRIMDECHEHKIN